MSIFDQIIFIADYIEPGRTYPSCIAVRDYLLGSLKHGDTEKNIIALHKACIMSIEYTVKSLLQRGKSVCPESLQAKNALEAKIK
jgi:HD superfamily phosphohydrolase YqeK